MIVGQGLTCSIHCLMPKTGCDFSILSCLTSNILQISLPSTHRLKRPQGPPSDGACSVEPLAGRSKVRYCIHRCGAHSPPFSRISFLVRASTEHPWSLHARKSSGSAYGQRKYIRKALRLQVPGTKVRPEPLSDIQILDVQP